MAISLAEDGEAISLATSVLANEATSGRSSTSEAISLTRTTLSLPGGPTRNVGE